MGSIAYKTTPRRKLSLPAGFFHAPCGEAPMRIITISREYGAGGEEVGKRLAEDLGWKLLDRELLHQAAAVEHVPDAEARVAG